MSARSGMQPETAGPASGRSPILAYTSEDGRFDVVRRAGIDLARKAGVPLILYDVDAAGLFGEEPLPTWFASEREGDLYPGRLEPHDLEALGRHEIARQVADARREGADAYGWLTGSKAAGRLAQYVREQGVGSVLVPAALDEPNLLERIRGDSAEAIREQVNCEVFLVDEGGTVRVR